MKEKFLALAIVFTALFITHLAPSWAANPTHIDIRMIDADGPNYTLANNVVTITRNGHYVITGTTNIRRVVVQPGLVDVNITLSDLNIDAKERNATAFYMKDAEVNLTLVGDNTLISGNRHAGLYVPSGATLVITKDSKGSLIVTGGEFSAGIGGSGNESSSGGSITIMGGTVTANGGDGGGAGIGGGGIITLSDDGGASGNITITDDANVTATGGSNNRVEDMGYKYTAWGGGAGIGSGAGYGELEKRSNNIIFLGGKKAGELGSITINNTGRRDFKGGTGGTDYDKNQLHGAAVGTGGGKDGPGMEYSY